MRLTRYTLQFAKTMSGHHQNNQQARVRPMAWGRACTLARVSVFQSQTVNSVISACSQQVAPAGGAANSFFAGLIWFVLIWLDRRQQSLTVCR